MRRRMSGRGSERESVTTVMGLLDASKYVQTDVTIIWRESRRPIVAPTDPLSSSVALLFLRGGVHFVLLGLLAGPLSTL